ncbi:MAG: hypothetical protein ABI823_13545 [Bryobacteraceae bacterium]
MPSRKQPWLYSPAADGAFILAPAFAVTALVFAFPGFFQAPVTPLAWLLLIVGVDVAHVYSTLYRTYFDPEERARYSTLLYMIPALCWVGGVLLYSAGSMVFWRVLAYVAAYHFVRQQYGFLRLYSRKDALPAWKRRLDGAAIYAATLYPLIYWHTHDRVFAWFVAGDFLRLSLPGLEQTARLIYIALLAAYVISEAVVRRGNLPKNLILAGTVVSWYTGIVVFNGDLAFTVTNVVAHGIPYMALVWMYERRQTASAAPPKRAYLQRWFVPAMIPAFLGLLIGFAYIEEALWDVLVWRQHTQFFAWLAFLPGISNDMLLALLVPLLALPQATHYVLDGFIWRIRTLSYDRA